MIQKLDKSVDLAALHRCNPDRYPFLLQSTAAGRFDILFAFPGESLTLDYKGKLKCPDQIISTGNDFLAAFDRWWQIEKTDTRPAEDLPFFGGWFVYLGYELAGQIEPVLKLHAGHPGMPVAVAVRVQSALVRDHDNGCISVVTETGCDNELKQIMADIDSITAIPPAPPSNLHVRELIEEAPTHFLDAVGKIHSYIREGDVFQVNLSRQWDVELDDTFDTADLQARLAVSNPSPFSGFARLGDYSIISSSPERLVSVCGAVVETRPIAGTRPRAKDSQQDAAYSSELLAHPKEQAEHIMLIDLERNDLGRICEPGSIEVNEFMVLESYAHVHHIVSNVRGRLKDRTTPGDVIRAVFPGGTITGCPKVRCMEIISELEQTARNAYTGSMGYINCNGDMDLNILIRTIIAHGNRLSFRAGAGIVADSIADAELEETRAKALGLLNAVGCHRKNTVSKFDG